MTSRPHSISSSAALRKISTASLRNSSVSYSGFSARISRKILTNKSTCNCSSFYIRAHSLHCAPLSLLTITRKNRLYHGVSAPPVSSADRLRPTLLASSAYCALLSIVVEPSTCCQSDFQRRLCLIKLTYLGCNLYLSPASLLDMPDNKSKISWVASSLESFDIELLSPAVPTL